VFLITKIYAVEPPEQIKFDTPKMGKTNVTFQHVTHINERIPQPGNCQHCHHTATTPEEVQACRICHDDSGSNVKPIFKDIVHNKVSTGHDRSCIGCHTLRTDKPNAPTKNCVACHKK
jgi:hypothetical protein